HEPTTPADDAWIPQNEPGPLAADRTPQNEPGPPVGGDLASQKEPAGPVPIAGLGVPALVCALLILLATALPAAFAGPVARPIGQRSMTPATRAGPAVRVGPFPQHRYRLDDAGQKVARACGKPKPDIGSESANSVRTFRSVGIHPTASPAETRRPAQPS